MVAEGVPCGGNGASRSLRIPLRIFAQNLTGHSLAQAHPLQPGVKLPDKLDHSRTDLRLRRQSSGP